MPTGPALAARHLTRVLGAAANAQVTIYSFASFYSAVLAEYAPRSDAVYSIRLVLVIVYQLVIGGLVALDLGSAEAKWGESFQRLGMFRRAHGVAYHVLYTVPLFSLGILFSLIACFFPYELESWFELPQIIVLPLALGVGPLVVGYTIGRVASSKA